MKKIVSFVLLLSFAYCGFGNIKEYKPDLSKSDIYLKHLKRTPLSGWWQINKVSTDKKNNPNDNGQKNKFFAKDFDDSKWNKDIVPNELHVPFTLPKKARATDWGARIKYIPQDVREWGGIIYMRKDFKSPRFSKDEKAILFFEEIAGDFTLYINGKKIASRSNFVSSAGYKGPKSILEFDVTSVIIPNQENNITLRLFNSCPTRWGWGSPAGILGLVYLDIRPQAYTNNILVTPQTNLKDLLFDCIVSGSENMVDTQNWSGEIFEWDTHKVVSNFKLGKPYIEDKLRFISGSGSIENPKLWNCENPYLYGVRVKNSRGEVTGVQRFGMRTFGVKDGDFVLNGTPIALRGLAKPIFDGIGLPLQAHGWLYAARTNTDDAFRKYLDITFKDSNVNHVRTHSSTLARGTYDLLDEYGILVSDELDYPTTRIKNPKFAELIDVKGFDGACNAKGKLLSEFVSKTKARIRRSYSHPSLVMTSFGNEIRQYDDPRVEGLLNNLYDLYKSVDKQKRPTTNSSGRFWKDGRLTKELHDREKFDYIATHDYTGSINNFPLGYCEWASNNFSKIVKKCFGGKMAPIVNGETVYFAQHYHGNIMNPIWKNRDDVQPNWDKMIYMLEQWRKDKRDQSFLGHYWIRNIGSKNYKYDRARWRGIYAENIVEAQRKTWPGRDGYEVLSGPYHSSPSAYPFKDIKFVPNDGLKYLARANSPVIGILDYIAPNLYTNEKIKSTVTCVNNSLSDYKDVKFIVDILDADKKKVSSKIFDVGDLKVNQKNSNPIEFSTPKTQGRYMIDYRLESNGKLLNQRDRWLIVRNRDDIFKAIITDKKIAVYDIAALFGGLKPFNTVDMLKRFGVKFVNVTDFKNLKRFDILIIGSGSIDANVQQDAGEIRTFVENGGRLLVFDQTFVGRVPFLQELEFSLAGPGQFTEIMKFDHPVFKDLTQESFFCWNQKDWSIYRYYITPISQAALSIGGDTTQWGSDHFGMVSAHLKLGKGDVIMSQTELAKVYKKDSGAALFARQLIETIINDKTRTQATEFKGLSVLKAKPINAGKAKSISLKKVANMSFKDKADNDGKGGWTDQGKNNDLGPIPLGKQTFGGIEFDIINPSTNKGKSCIVVSDNTTRKIKEKTVKIEVNLKAKRLLFLHATAWTPKGVAGGYIVKYTLGREEVISLNAGVEIDDWWNAPSKQLAKADCVWGKMNSSGVVGLYLYEWLNPKPQEEIKSIKVIAKNGAVLGLVAITAEI